LQRRVSKFRYSLFTLAAERPLFRGRMAENHLAFNRIQSGRMRLFLVPAGVVCLLALRVAQTAPQIPAESQFLNARLGVAYVGDEACRECHQPQYNSFKKTSMGRSISLPAPAKEGVGAKPVTLAKPAIDRTYTVSSHAGKLIHTESELGPDGKPDYSDSHEIAYTVGTGDVGRSYLVAKGDALFVSPISYYSATHQWDLSPGYDSGQFRGFTRPAWNLCLFCHSGLPRPVAGTRNRYQNPPFLILPIGCERCHGPGEIHVKERRANAPPRLPVDFSIVNPARVAQPLRNDICRQCHLLGDAEILRPGKTYLDYRPGTSLASVVSIFSAPVNAKPDRIRALSHPEQIELSRCSIESKGSLACITCHDPHIQLYGNEAVTYFRRKCQACHANRPCSASAARRNSTAPPDNCISCHMPKRTVANINHSALTDHRILRNPDASPPLSPSGAPGALINHSAPFDQPDAKPDLRTLALAYYELSQIYPQFAKEGFSLLEQAARDYPEDLDVQASYGLVATLADSKSSKGAAGALQKALDLGSTSVEVQTRLASLRLDEGDRATALHLYTSAIDADPYYTPAYFGLARLYVLTNGRATAAPILEKILAYDPGNEAARRALADAKASAESCKP
jgi:hypothetical protein